MPTTTLSALPNSCNANPNQISRSSEWRGAKRTQKRLPTRYANPVVANHAPYSALLRPILAGDVFLVAKDLFEEARKAPGYFSK